ncbi:MAG: MFS transporter DHA3 family macrolide efflux protein [Bacillota bacterium]|nr:MAG: MFS transporter DHA3 family macrolide efflux protein [Bacillota bacterium]
MWGGQLISLLGDMLFDLALIWWVMNVTSSGMAISAVALAAALPSIILGPIIGVYVDRLDRRSLMIMSDVVNGVIMAGMAVLYWQGVFSLPLIVISAALTGIVSTAHGPAFQASIPVVVGKEDLVRVNSLIQTAGSTLGLMVPGISGLILAVAGVGASIMFNALSYSIAALSLLFVSFPSPRVSSPQNSVLRDAVQGMRFVFSHRLLLPMLIYAALINLTLAPVSIALPLLVVNKLGGGPALLGLFGSFRNGGVLLASLLLSTYPNLLRKMGLVMVFCIVAIGGFTVLIGASPNALGVLLGGAFVGFAVVVANVASQAIWQREVPDDLRGRAFAARETLTSGLRPMGLAAAGPLVDWIGPQWLMSIAGVLCAISGIVGFLVPTIVNYPQGTEEAPVFTN